MVAMKTFLLDCLRVSLLRWLVTAFLVLVLAATAGCSSTFTSQATRMLTPTSTPPLNSTMPILAESPVATATSGVQATLTPYPQYGHAQDFSWVAGVLEYQPLEGGCWTLVFSEKPEAADFYYGILALKLPTHLRAELRDSSFVVVTGRVIGQKFSMACPPTIYEVATVRLNRNRSR